MLTRNQSGFGLLELIIVLGIVGVLITTFGNIYIRKIENDNRINERKKVAKTINDIITFSTTINHTKPFDLSGDVILSELNKPVTLASGIAASTYVRFDNINNYKWMLSGECADGTLKSGSKNGRVIIKCNFLDAFKNNFKIQYLTYEYSRKWTNYPDVTRQVNTIKMLLIGTKQRTTATDLAEIVTLLTHETKQHRATDFSIIGYLVSNAGGGFGYVLDAAGNNVYIEDYLPYITAASPNVIFGVQIQIEPEKYPVLLRDGSVKIDQNSKLCWENTDKACIGSTATGISMDGDLDVNDNLIVGNDAVLENNLAVAGNSDFNGNVNIDGSLTVDGTMINTVRYRNGTILRTTVPITSRYTYNSSRNLSIAKPTCPAFNGTAMTPKIEVNIGSFASTNNVNLSDPEDPDFSETCDITTGDDCLGFISAAINAYRDKPGDTARYWEVSSVIGGDIDDDLEANKNPKSIAINVTTWCQL